MLRMMEGKVPSDIKTLYQSRIDALPPRQRETVLIASVIAHFSGSIDTDLLTELGGDDIPEEFLIPFGDGYIFTGTALCEVAYSMLLHARAAQLHTAIADIEKKRGAQPSLIARHAEAGGDMETAFTHYLKAGVDNDTIQGTRNLEKAVKLGRKNAWDWGRLDEYHRALGLLSQHRWTSGDFRQTALLNIEAYRTAIDDHQKAKILNSLSVALDAMGHNRFARHFYNIALGCQPSGDLKLEIITNLGINIAEGGDLEGGLSVYRSMEEEAKAHPQWPGSAILLSSIGWVERELGNLKDAASAYREALALDQERGDSYGEAIDRLNIAVIEIDLGNLEGAMAELCISLPIFWRYRDERGRINAINAIGEIFRKDGHRDRAIRQHSLALKLADKIGDTDLMEESREQLDLAKMDTHTTK